MRRIVDGSHTHDIHGITHIKIIDFLFKNLSSSRVEDELAEMVSRQFQSHSPIGKVIYDKQYSRLHGQLLENYINDFVYLTHPCASTHEHWVRH